MDDKRKDILNELEKDCVLNGVGVNTFKREERKSYLPKDLVTTVLL